MGFIDLFSDDSTLFDLTSKNIINFDQAAEFLRTCDCSLEKQMTYNI